MGRSCRAFGIGACLILALSLVLLSSCGGNEKERGEESPDKPSGYVKKDSGGIEGLVFERLDGVSIPFEELKGKLLVVNFWATWNTDSKQLFPMMNQIQDKFYKHVTVMMISVDKGGAAPVRRFMDDQMVAYEVYVNGEKVANTFGGVKTLPTTYIVLRDGKIFERIDGLKRKKVYEDALIRLLQHRM
jgi:cytochrome c biogenesis protein CcmG/thiol:disulfide interchange protein DsbE